MSLFSIGGILFRGLERFFIFLGVDAGGAQEVTAEISRSGETELESNLFDFNVGLLVHDLFGAGSDVLTVYRVQCPNSIWMEWMKKDDGMRGKLAIYVKKV
jgi:hypothetical protein